MMLPRVTSQAAPCSKGPVTTSGGNLNQDMSPGHHPTDALIYAVGERGAGGEQEGDHLGSRERQWWPGHGGEDGSGEKWWDSDLF